MRKTDIDLSDARDRAHGVLEQAASDPAFAIEIRDNNAKFLEALGLSPDDAASLNLIVGREICITIPMLNFHMCMPIN